MKNSSIAWTNHSQNFWIGCSGKNCEIKDYCYAQAQCERRGWNFKAIRPTQANIWSAPLRWNEEAKREGKSYRVFCSSMADFFDKQADGIRQAAWNIIRRCEHLTWMILTKRPEDIPARLPDDWGKGYSNVWLGTTVTSEKYTHRIDQLRTVPAVRRFVSAEPLTGPLGSPSLKGFDLLICGGMSGEGWQDHVMDLQWAKDALALARQYNVKFFFKQVSGRRDGQQPDALGRLYQELPKGPYPWMPEPEEFTIPSDLLPAQEN